MNALEQGLFEFLRSQATVTGKLADGKDGIYADEALENAGVPYVLFGESSGSPSYSLASRDFERFMYRVEAVSTGPDAKPAKTIHEALDAVLSDGEFTIPGRTLMYCRKISEIPRTETVDGTRYNRRGGIYEIWVG